MFVKLENMVSDQRLGMAKQSRETIEVEKEGDKVMARSDGVS